MFTTQTKFLAAGVFFLFTFLSGFWLSRSGKPYSTLIFTLHKFIALSAILYLIVTINRGRQALAGSLPVMALVATILIFLAILVAGGLLSIHAAGQLANLSPGLLAAMGGVHRFFPYLAVISTGATLYLLLM